MAYSKVLARKYATNRGRYRSSDHLLSPIIKRLKLKGRTILDFGCGDGPEVEMFLSMKVKRVVGVDPSEEMIRLAKKRRLPMTNFFKSTSIKLPLKSDQFDLVYSRFVLHYIKNLDAPFKEIARVLKKEAYFLAMFQCLTNNPKLLNKKVPFHLGEDEAVTKIKIFSKSPNEIKMALKNSSLKLIELTRVKNNDAHFDPNYKNIHKFRNFTYILLAQKVTRTSKIH